MTYPYATARMVLLTRLGQLAREELHRLCVAAQCRAPALTFNVDPGDNAYTDAAGNLGLSLPWVLDELVPGFDVGCPECEWQARLMLSFVLGHELGHAVDVYRFIRHPREAERVADRWNGVAHAQLPFEAVEYGQYLASLPGTHTHPEGIERVAHLYDGLDEGLCPICNPPR